MDTVASLFCYACCGYQVSKAFSASLDLQTWKDPNLPELIFQAMKHEAVDDALFSLKAPSFSS